MPAQEYKRYFEALELDQDASLQEVRHSYQHLKGLYTSESIATYPIMDELTDEARRRVLESIEEAYEKLLEYFDRGGASGTQRRSLPRVDPDLRGEVANISSFDGRTLKWVRERLGLELEEVSLATKIHKQYLLNMELEKFSSLPPEVYIRGYVGVYARYLSLDPAKVSEDYIQRYRAWKGGQGPS